MMHSKRSKSKQNPKSLKDYQLRFEAIGTAWQIDLYNIDHFVIPNVQELILNLIENFDKTYSRFRDDSLVKKISGTPGEYLLDSDGKKMLDLYWQLYKATEGKFTPLIGNVLEDAGYDQNYSLIPKKLQKPDKWEDVLEVKDKLVTKKPVLLDFGAIGKGYLIDLIGKLLEDYSIKSYCIDAGGDILYRNQSEKPLQVGLENPQNLQQVVGVAYILNQSICGSAGNRRKWQEFHHIINPHTLKSPDDILAVWVIAENAAIADGLSTALFLVEPEKLEKSFNFEYMILYKDFSVKKSIHFPSELYYN